MTECTACGDKPKHTAKGFPKAVVEIINPEQLVLLRRVDIPASMGTEEDVPAAIGKYRNVLLVYEANEHIYLYSSDGIPTLLSTDIGDLEHIEEAIRELQGDVETLSSSLSSEITAREVADTALGARIDGVATAIETEETRRISADDALRSSINTVSGNLSAEISARQNADTAIRGDLTTLTGRVTTAEGDIDTIEGKIPNQATAQNQLADKNFVNSSIATNTANFIGTFNSVAELEAYSGTVTNNDYAFVIVTDAQGNTAYDRYKYNGDTEQWMFEYELNNSSFTAVQWAAINSGITSGGVTKLTGLAEIKTVGSNLNLDANGQLSGNYTHFTGATPSTDGAQGLVPAPLAGDDAKFLKADGTWATVNAGPTVVQTTGTSTTDVMSQNATTSMVYNDPSTKQRVRIGDNATALYSTDGIAIGRNAYGAGNRSIAIGAGTNSTDRAETSGDYSIAIGAGAQVRTISTSPRGSIALGAYSVVSGQSGIMNIGSSQTYYGYNNSNYRLLTGLYDPQSAHDAATKGYVDDNIPATFTTNEWNALWA